MYDSFLVCGYEAVPDGASEGKSGWPQERGGRSRGIPHQAMFTFGVISTLGSTISMYVVNDGASEGTSGSPQERDRGRGGRSRGISHQAMHAISTYFPFPHQAVTHTYIYIYIYIYILLPHLAIFAISTYTRTASGARQGTRGAQPSCLKGFILMHVSYFVIYDSFFVCGYEAVPDGASEGKCGSPQ